VPEAGERRRQATGNFKLQTSNLKLQTPNFKPEMTLQQLQTDVDEWIKTVGVRYFGELTNLGILMEEVGELSRLMVRKYGEQSAKPTEAHKELADERADVLWVLVCLANQTGVDLTTAMQKNIEKKTLRDKDRHQQNEKLQ
jgi:NTP pyrophosphatase (non-canonical NTP hydrolase)